MFCIRQVPAAKKATKWETFAKLKGIQKKKKTRMIYDEELKVIQIKIFSSAASFCINLNLDQPWDCLDCESCSE